ncbi:hypothetical protein V2J09_015891 [Rumex salicifolius]
MAAVASSDKAAELLQNLSLDSKPKTIEVHDATKKFGSVGSINMVNGLAKPFERATPTPPLQDYSNLNTYYAPHGYMSRDLIDAQSGLQQQNLNSGVGHTAGYMGRLHPNNQVYGHFGNTYSSGTGFGLNYYNSKASWNGGWQSVGSKYTPKGNGMGFFRYGNDSKDRLNELSKGPRADSMNNQLVPGSFKVKGQDLPVNVNATEQKAPAIPDRSQYNKGDFPENYSEAKFFVIKSYSEDDVHKSIKYNVWSSTPNGNKKLEAAYQEAQAKPGGCPVFLLFSVNSSGQFVGLAEMVGPVDFNKTVDFWQQDKWIGCFSVKWHIVKDVPNSLLKHIKLENNDNKPSKETRWSEYLSFTLARQVSSMILSSTNPERLLCRKRKLSANIIKNRQDPKELKDARDAKDTAIVTNGEAKVEDRLLASNPGDAAKSTKPSSTEKNVVPNGNAADV